MQTRRTFLGSVAGAGLALAAFPAIRLGRAAGTPLKNIVVLLQENHSFDQYFGLYPGADGFPPCAPVSAADSLCQPTPPHDIAAAEAAIASSDLVEGFRTAGGSGALTYYTGRDLPYYWALAARFVLCDRYFCSALGGTLINRVFSVAAEPGGIRDNDTAGSDQLPTVSIADRLDEAGVDWRCYVAHQPTGYNAIAAFPRQASDPRSARPFAEFLADAARGKLPAVSWIVSADPLAEHPPSDVSWGERFAALVANTFAAGPQWKDGALVLSYDENGGFYDHVRPPRVQDFFSLGFRVPALVVSPYARAGHVSSTVYEHCSTLALIERTFSLPPLTSRDADADPFTDAFDFSRRELGFVDYRPRSLDSCGAAPSGWPAELLALPVPPGTPVAVPSARDLCQAAPSVDLTAGIVGGIAAGAAAAAAGLRRRERARPPEALGTPRSPASPPRTRP